MKKNFVYSALCVFWIFMFCCAGCSKEEDSGERMTADSGKTMVEDFHEQTGQDASPGTEEIHPEFNPETKTKLVWMAPYGVAKGDDDVYIEFNNLLDRKGYDFYVSFYTPGNDLEEYVRLLYDASASGQEIDIFSTGYDYYGGLYGDLVRDGLCREWNTYLESADGKALYDTRDELVWESLSVEGKIYGLTGTPAVSGSGGQFYYVNPDMAEKYGIDCERLFEDAAYFWESIFAVEEGERAEEGFEPYIKTGAMFDYPEDMIPLRMPVALRADPEGKYQAVNLFEDERIRRAIIACNELWKRGYTVREYSQDQIEAGNFFVIASAEPLECENAMEFIRPAVLANKSGAITCIADWSGNKEAAFELLCAVHTDRELSEILAFGIEGIHYHVEGEKVLKTEVDYAGRHADLLLANVQLLRDSDYGVSHSASLSEAERASLRSNPLFGNPLDCREIKNKLQELYSCAGISFPDYLENSPWVNQDFEQKYDEGLRNLKDAGIDEVLNEINQQLRDRGLQ